MSLLLSTGTLRFNVDPLNEYSDAEIMEAVALSNFLETFHGRSSLSSTTPTCDVLNYAFTEAGSTLSQGQRQLLSLARALLHQSKVLLMDEISSAIDSASEEILFKVLHNHMTRNPASVLIIISHSKAINSIKKLCNKVIRFEDDNRVYLEDL